MLFTNIEFEKYKPKIFKIFGLYENRDKFEEYLSKTLQTGNLKIYISNILRAMNILLGNDTNKYINEIDDLKLLVKLNLEKNKNKLLEFKEDERVKRYLRNVDENKLDILIKLSKILDDIDIEKIDLSNLKVKTIEDNILKEKKVEIVKEIKKGSSIIDKGIRIYQNHSFDSIKSKFLDLDITQKSNIIKNMTSDEKKEILKMLVEEVYFPSSGKYF